MNAPRRCLLVAATYLPQLLAPDLLVPLAAQALPQWERLVGGPLGDGSGEPACDGSRAGRKSVLATDDGGAVVLGFSIDAAGGPYVARYSPSGEVVWYHVLPEVDGVGFGMELARWGPDGVIVAGTHEPNGYPAGRDIWVGRYLPSGSPAFFVTLDFGHGIHDVAPRIATDSEGRIYGSAFHSDGTSVFALSALGGLLWHAYFAGESVNDLAPRDNLGVAVALSGANGPRIVALDLSGASDWSHSILTDPARTESVRAIAASATGIVALVGDSCAAGACELLAGSIGKAGRAVWIRRLSDPGVGPSSGRAIAIEEDGRIFVAGAHVPPGAGGAKALVAALDPSGGLTWFDSVANSPPTPTVSSSFEALALHSQDRLLVAGKSDVTSTDADLVVARYVRSSGEVDWIRAFDSGMNRDDVGCDVDAGTARDRAMVTASARRTSTDQWTLSLGAGGDPSWSAREPDLRPPQDHLGGSWTPIGIGRGALAVGNEGETLVAGTGTDGADHGALLARLDPSGETLALVVLPNVGRTSSRFTAVSAAADDSAFAGGESRLNGSLRFLTAKFDRDGSSAWVREIVGGGGGEARRVLGMPDGGVVATGVVRPNYNDDLLTIRYGADGGELWERRIDEYVESGIDLTGTGTGVAVLADSRPSVGSVSECLVVAYSDTGEERFRTRIRDSIGRPSSARCTVIDSDSSGRLYVGGTGSDGPFVALLMSDGLIQWRAPVSPEGSEAALSALRVVEGVGAFVAGPVQSTNGWTGWTALVSESGQIDWLRLFDGDSSPFIARDLAIGSDERVYVSATSHDSLGLVVFDREGNLVDLVRSTAALGGHVTYPAAVQSTADGRIVAAASAYTTSTNDDIHVVSIELPTIFRDGFESGDLRAWK